MKCVLNGKTESGCRIIKPCLLTFDSSCSRISCTLQCLLSEIVNTACFSHVIVEQYPCHVVDSVVWHDDDSMRCQCHSEAVGGATQSSQASCWRILWPRRPREVAAQPTASGEKHLSIKLPTYPAAVFLLLWFLKARVYNFVYKTVVSDYLGGR